MCDCISDVDNRLRDHNAGLVTTILSRPERVVIATQKIAKKRGSTPHLIASFCPFCGEKYAAAEARVSALRQAADLARKAGE